MTPQEFIGVARITLDEVRLAEARGADRKRRSIRRAQREALEELKRHWGGFWREKLDIIDNATRAKPRRKK